MIPTPLRPLRHRPYALMWGSGLVSNTGTWMQTVAVGALVTDLTGQPAWTALAYVAAFLPNGVLAPIGGSLSDRLDRKRFIVASLFVQSGVAGVLAFLVATGHGAPGVVVGMVFLDGCVAALRMPFQQSLLPDLVPREDIVGAVSLGSAQWNLGRVVGPSLAGAVIVAGSFSLAFAINAATYLVVVVAMLVIRLPARSARDEWVGLRRHVREGMRAVKDDPGCRTAILLIAAAALLTAPFMSLIPAFAQALIEGDRKALGGATGAMTTGQGVGAVIGSLSLATVAHRFGRRRAISFHLVGAPLALIPYALSPNVAFATVALVAVGGLYIGILSGLSAVIQLRAAEEYRGRALSLYFATLSVVFAVGAAAQGAIAGFVGLRVTHLVSGLLMLGVVVWFRTARPHLLAALETDHGEAALVTQPAASAPSTVLEDALPGEGGERAETEETKTGQQSR